MWIQLSRNITDISAKAALSADEASANAFFFFSQQHKLLDIWMDLFPPRCLFVPADVAGEEESREACQGFSGGFLAVAVVMGTNRAALRSGAEARDMHSTGKPSWEQSERSIKRWGLRRRDNDGSLSPFSAVTHEKLILPETSEPVAAKKHLVWIV